jgi:transposase
MLTKAERFVEHELLTPDMNAVENAIRPFVVGRKNWLFNDSERGAHASAGIYSLIGTAKANCHEPLKYLSYLFDELPKKVAKEDREALAPHRLSPEEY